MVLSFYFANVGQTIGRQKHLLLFLSNTGAELLRTYTVWMLGGTFSSTPAPFSQIYIVMARSENGGQGLACGFALLPNKNSSTYDLCFNKYLRKLALKMI